MLGIRLSPDAEAELARHARDVGRPKSELAREWILERLARDSVDQQMRRASQVIALHESTRAGESSELSDKALEAWASALDSIDGGYDWGEAGPPQ